MKVYREDNGEAGLKPMPACSDLGLERNCKVYENQEGNEVLRPPGVEKSVIN